MLTGAGAYPSAPATGGWHSENPLHGAEDNDDWDVRATEAAAVLAEHGGFAGFGPTPATAEAGPATVRAPVRSPDVAFRVH